MAEIFSNDTVTSAHHLFEGATFLEVCMYSVSWWQSYTFQYRFVPKYLVPNSII